MRPHLCRSGRAVPESVGCGTAAVILPIAAVRTPDGSFTVGDGRTGPVTMLRESLLGVQHGRA